MPARPLAFLAALLIGPTLAASAQEGSGDRYALLIGVKDYDPKELIPVPHAENDVNDLAAVLIKGGFRPINVEVMTQAVGATKPKFFPTAANIRARLALLMKGRRPGDVIVIAFSGHGVQFRGEDVPYFCPVDAKLDRRETLISLREVYKELEASDAGLKLLLSDACRNDPASNVARELKRIELESVSRPQAVELPGGVAAFFSCSAGQQAFAHPDLKHGVFFHHVIETLDDPELVDAKGGLTLPLLEFRVKQQVQDYVRAELGELQTPAFESKVRGLPALLAHRDPVPGRMFAGMRAGEQRSDDNTLGMTFCWCPPTGARGFRMGSPEGEPARNPLRENEAQVTVRLTRGFWMGKHEVTQAQWQQVMGDNPSHFSSEGEGRAKIQGMDTGRFPVEGVSWPQAVAFCRKLTEREHKAGKLPADWEIRLPTEAEWEYACRAGTTTATAFGNTLSSRQANFYGDYPYNGASKGSYPGRTTRIGSYGANAWNLQDMHGNVAEWCLDAYQAKLPGGVDPLVPSEASPAKIARGGSWDEQGQFSRSALRLVLLPAFQLPSLGLRLARAPRVP